MGFYFFDMWACNGNYATGTRCEKNAYRVDNLSLEMFDFGSLKIIGFLVKYRDEIGWG